MASTSTEVTLTIKIDPARVEALALADKYVTDWTEQTKNQRGYVHDKWTPVEVMTRTEAVLKVADWLLTRPNLLSAPPAVPRETQHHASCHGSAGELVCDPRDHPPGY